MTNPSEYAIPPNPCIYLTVNLKYYRIMLDSTYTYKTKLGACKVLYLLMIMANKMLAVG